MMNGYFIGVMTGTSLDGVDLVLAQISANNFQVKHTASDCYPEPLRQSLLKMITSGHVSLADLGQCEHQLGQFYAKKINQWLTDINVDSKEIIAIGCHGQTVWHQPTQPYPFTMQIGDNNLLAANTQIPVVGDIRRMDMAYGGQGAPLVPAFHDALFRDNKKTVVAVNIGGISNISVMEKINPVYGFDTGPGNTLLDLWVARHLQKKYDHNAEFALQGNVNKKLLHALLSDPYFKQPAPKSTGREYFNAQWLDDKFKQFNIKIGSPADVQATLCQLTATTIIQSLPKLTDEVIVCGGGCHNPLIMRMLSNELPSTNVVDSSQYSLDPDFVEAGAFAWLAHRRVNKLQGNSTEVTGASQGAILGALYHP